MDTKRYLYAAVGAPIVVGKSALERVDDLRSRLRTRSEDLGREAKTRFDEWSSEGEELLTRLKDAEAIDELTSKMDLEQVQEQVSKLRDQLEDLLDTWRHNFRPAGKVEVTVEASAEGAVKEEEKPAATKAAATASKTAGSKTTATKKAPAKKAPAKKAAG